MAKGNTKSSQWVLIINPYEKVLVNASNEQRKEHLQEQLTKIVNCNAFKYSFSIVHDRDKHEGKDKTIHAHSFLVLNEKKTQKELLGTLAELLEAPKEVLTLSPTNNEFLQVQYLTHKNDKNKASYEYEDIITNNAEELNRRYNQVYEDKATKEAELLTDIFEINTLSELTRKYGLEIAKKYQGIFKQIKQEQNQDIEALSRVCAGKTRQVQRLADYFNDIFNKLDNTLTEEQKKAIMLEFYKSAVERVLTDELPF